MSDAGNGDDKTFTTPPNPTPPGVAVPAPARHHGDQREHLRDAEPARRRTTTYYFQYGTSTRYGGRTPDPPADAGNGTTAATVAAALTGLQPYTRYHWRLVATNAAGTTRGPDRSFTTARAPTAVSLGVSRSTVVWGAGLSLGGRVTGPGSVALTVALAAAAVPVRGELRGRRDRADEQGRRLPVHDRQPVRRDPLPRRHAHADRRHEPGGHGPRRGAAGISAPQPVTQARPHRGLDRARRARRRLAPAPARVRTLDAGQAGDRAPGAPTRARPTASRSSARAR